MAIDFSQVKTITIPEGSVKKITDSTGNILWQGGGQSEGWHTIWEGSKTCSLTKSGTNTPVVSGEVPSLVHTAYGTGYTPKIRITFSYSNTNTDYNNWKNEFILNFKTVTTMSSPVTIDAVVDNALFKSANICNIMCTSSNDNKVSLSVGLKKNRDTNIENNRITIDLKGHWVGNLNSYASDFTLTFTVTKIEQYY